MISANEARGLHIATEKLLSSQPGQQAVATVAGVAAAILPGIAAAPLVAGLAVTMGAFWGIHKLYERFK